MQQIIYSKLNSFFMIENPFQIVFDMMIHKKVRKGVMAPIDLDQRKRLIPSGRWKITDKIIPVLIRMDTDWIGSYRPTSCIGASHQNHFEQIHSRVQKIEDSRMSRTQGMTYNINRPVIFNEML